MRRERRIDLAIALLALATSVAVMFAHGFGTPDADVRDGDAIGVALLAAMNLPLIARRWRPLPVFCASAAATVGIDALGYPGELGLWPAIAVYSLGAHARDHRAARTGGLIAGATFAAMGAVAVVVDPDPGIVAGAAGWAGAWVAGDVTRQRRQRMGELRERAERAEREARRERRLAAVEERMRIARELHDSAGHALSVMLVQAGAARLLHDSDPEGSKRALSTVEHVARSTIDEIDRMVSALREEGEVGTAPAPPAGTADIEELAERHRASGLEVAVRREGRRDHEPDAGVDRAAYRIVQEALTNAARHGDGAAEVLVRFGDERLELAITNPVSADGEGSEGGGHGLVGMRERAALLGGRLEAGRENGVFRVRAELPYDGARS